jgi:hypothetical protein
MAVHRLLLTTTAMLAALVGCVSSGKMTVARDFSLAATTKIAMAPGPDPKGFRTVLENELLEAGFDVAPLELA